MGRMRASAVLMHLISCGSISVKEHGSAVVPRGRDVLTRGRSDLSGKDLDRLMENPGFTGLDKEYFSGSLVETKKTVSEGTAEFPGLKRSSSYNADRNLDNNNFTGSIPESFESLTKLSNLSINCNPSLSDQLPTGLSKRMNFTLNSGNYYDQEQTPPQRNNYADGVFRIDRLESLLTESLCARTEQSLVRGEVEETDSRAAIKQGAFVREIILQEVAKGIDAFGMATLDTITSTASSRLPFVISYSSSSMGHEDIANLQTLRRLLLLLSKLQKNESSTAKLKWRVISDTNSSQVVMAVAQSISLPKICLHLLFHMGSVFGDLNLSHNLHNLTG